MYQMRVSGTWQKRRKDAKDWDISNEGIDVAMFW